MIYAIVAVLVLIADQAVKLWTTKNILLGAAGDDCVELIRGVVHMTNIHNTGAAFSILSGAQWFLIAVSAVFVIVIIVLITQEIIHTPFGKWTAVLIIAGALGNCIDRILYGYVVDMFEFEFINFPVFNVADIFITVAGILFCIHVIFHNEPEAVKAANEPAFIRRRREAKEAKEAPFAKIPKRGEHVSLEEEMRAPDPDDPFAEWEFGGSVPAEKENPDSGPEAEPEAGAGPKAQTESDSEPAQEAEPAPEPEQQPEPGLDAEPAPEPEQASEPEAEPAPEPEAEPAPEPEPTPEQKQAREDLFGSFLLEAEDAEEALRPAPEAETKPAPAEAGTEDASAAADSEAPAPEKKPAEGGFTLEDILAEFGDL